MSSTRLSTLPALALAVLGLGGTCLALAQGDGRTVYRCADGQYGQTPCPGGRQIDTGPAPTPQQQREAREAALTEARLAEQLRQERHAREREAAGRGPARIGPAPVAASRPSHTERKRGKRKKDPAAPPRADAADAQPFGGDAKSRKAYAPKTSP